jgi:DNA adenine methylase
MELARTQVAFGTAAPHAGTDFVPSRDAFLCLRSIAAAADISPLRYPGGKRKLAVLIAEVFATTRRRVRLLVEPFAGGASVSIAMLEAGFADEIALGDRDLMVASFWRTVFSAKAEALARRVENAEVSLRARDRVIASRPTSDIGRAFQCLYINRTSFSGIINKRAGAIGGRAQDGEYRVGCRFNQERIADRIRQLGALRDRVRFVRHQGYESTISDVRGLIGPTLSERDVFWYFDPPFFEKAERLYRHVFADADHRTFRAALDTVPGEFVLSYDDVPAATELYGNDPRSMAVPMVYSAAENNRPTQEIIVSNLLTSPGTKISVNAKTRFIKAKPAKRKSRE